MSFLESLSSDRPLRSILVSNLPLEVNEEHLKELFAEFGLVLNTRFFRDESCVHSLCEFGNQEMARSAIQSLNNFDMNGKIIAADVVGSAKSKAVLQVLAESSSGFQGEDAPIEKAPEEISKAVASLPAEQMFELMKQMKMCIENNPQEARNLLLQNPQLAYALLQAQVIMRIVDPEVALKILNRPTNIAPTVGETSNIETAEMDTTNSTSALAADQDLRRLPPVDQDFRTLPAAASLATEDKDMRQMAVDVDLRTMPPGMVADGRPFDPRFRPGDPRMDPRAAQMRPPNPSLPLVDPRSMPVSDPRIDPRLMQQDPRSLPITDPRMMPVSDPRAVHAIDPRSVPAPSAVFGLRPPAVDPRNMQPAPAQDPRKMPSAGMPANVRMPGTSAPANLGGIPSVRPSLLPGGKIPEDEEKAALIMQVLQLSEDQIAMLPPEQRQSIILLKEQIARSQFSL